MAYVEIRDNESLDSAIKRFKKLVEREGILREFREREFFEKPSIIEHRHVREIQHKRMRKQLKNKKRRPSYGRDERDR